MGYTNWETVYLEQYMFECCKHICVDVPDRMDSSIDSAMRCLLSSRTSDEVSWVMWRSDIERTVEVWQLDHFRDHLRVGANIVFFNDECVKTAEEYFNKLGEGWKALNKAEVFFSKRIKGCRTICYINEAKRQAVVITGKKNASTIHTLAAGIPVYLPWYFKNDPVSDSEKKLIQALLDDDVDAFVSAANDIAERYDIYKEFVKRTLSGFENKVGSMALTKAQRELDDIEKNLTRIYDQMCVLLELRRDKEYLISGIRQSKQSSSEIMQYFLMNRNLQLIGTFDTRITFAVTGTLSFWDVEHAKQMVENEFSVFYRRGFDNGKIKKLMQAIFVDQAIAIKFSSAYTIDLNGRVDGERDYSIVNGYMPNPHISQYECLGDYRREIVTFLSDGFYISAIDQCIASAGSLNVGDFQVMEKFMENLDSYGRVFVLPDGSLVDLNGAFEFVERSTE